MRTVNDIMDEEEQDRQVIMAHGKPTPIKDVIKAIKKKAKDKRERSFSEG